MQFICGRKRCQQQRRQRNQLRRKFRHAIAQAAALHAAAYMQGTAVWNIVIEKSDVYSMAVAACSSYSWAPPDLLPTKTSAQFANLPGLASILSNI